MQGGGSLCLHSSPQHCTRIPVPLPLSRWAQILRSAPDHSGSAERADHLGPDVQVSHHAAPPAPETSSTAEAKAWRWDQKDGTEALEFGSGKGSQARLEGVPYSSPIRPQPKTPSTPQFWDETISGARGGPFPGQPLILHMVPFWPMRAPEIFLVGGWGLGGNGRLNLKGLHWKKGKG